LETVLSTRNRSDEPRERDPEFVEALARGLEIIQAFTSDTPEMTLSEISVKTGVTPATARRSLLTLQKLGYVAMTGRRFILRARILTLGSAFLNSMNLKLVADSFLQSVADRFHDSVSMTLLDDDDVLYVAHVPSNRENRYRARIGYRLPAYATSTGHVLLAHLDQPAQDAFLARAPFPTYTARTTSTADELRAIFENVRRDDHAAIQDQLEYGIVGVAVPVRDHANRVIAAINCAAEAARVDLATLVSTRVAPLHEAAAMITAALARHPALAHSILADKRPL
jgi:IclR family transcriptional regulator, pca regulon regulatory protein